MLSEKQHSYLAAMDIQVWQSKEPKVAVNSNKPDWDQLRKEIANCKLCDLHTSRTNTVFGVGNRHADLLVVGEAPGATEDAQGEPFVGKAGRLLDSMLAAISLHRDDIFIANILKCRPPDNRDPKPNEVELCTPYLKQQIAFIKPKLIVAVGRIAAHFLLDTNEALGKLRGRTFSYAETNVPLIVTYHPAYLLRSPREKSKAYVDMLRVQEML